MTGDGTIKHLYTDKKFGFILGSDGRDYFFHTTDVVKPCTFMALANGQRVTFDGADSSRGARARAVRVG